MEKLIEQIIEVWKAYDGVERAPSWARKLRARRTIALIGKAYVDGELELPGEVGRGVMRTKKKGIIGTAEGDRWFYDIKQGAFITSRHEDLDSIRNIPIVALSKEEDG